MKKQAFFFIDDVIWVFRDLTPVSYTHLGEPWLFIPNGATYHSFNDSGAGTGYAA